MATSDLYRPKGNHSGINLIKQRQRNKYRLGSDKTTLLFFWQWPFPFETNTDVFGWFLMLLKNSPSFSLRPGGFHWSMTSTASRAPPTPHSLPPPPPGDPCEWLTAPVKCHLLWEASCKLAGLKASSPVSLQHYRHGSALAFRHWSHGIGRTWSRLSAPI